MRKDPEVGRVEAAAQAQAVSVQTLAFGADPVMRFIYPEPDQYLECSPKFAAAFGGRAFEHDGAFQADNFGGVSFWLPPGVEPDAEALGGLVQSTVAPAIQKDLFAVLEQMGVHHIEEPHWYLAIVGVDPSRQGSGLGSALLAHTLRTCDEQHLPAYLESSNPANVPLYERHGFRVITEIQVGASPIVYPMLRAAK